LIVCEINDTKLENSDEKYSKLDLIQGS